MRRHLLLVVAFPLALVAGSVACVGGGERQSIAGVVTVIDGDTLDVAGKRVRMFGIDAPETGQLCRRPGGSGWPCGQHATVALDRLAGGKKAVCRVQTIDSYERAVAVCKVGGKDLGAELVRAGWAVAYRRYSDRYAGDEEAARRAGIGIWGGDFDPPWDWRHRHPRH